MKLETKATWTYPEVDALRQQVGVEWEEFAEAVGLSVNYLQVHARRNYLDPTKYQPLGKLAFSAINAFVEAWNRTHGNAPANVPPTPTQMGTTLESVTSLLYELLRAAPPNDAVTVHLGVQRSGRFLVRRTFTQCPKCRHTDEKAFEFRTVEEAEAAYDQARRWTAIAQDSGLSVADGQKSLARVAEQETHP